jgi:hypothetical protein
MSVEPAGPMPGAMPPGVMPAQGSSPFGGMPTAIRTRVREELTPELIDRIKETLAEIGLPPVIYKFGFDKDTFVFRPMLGRDWAEIQQFIAMNEGRLSQEAVDHKICEKAVLWPNVTDPVMWDVQRAGYQSTLAKHVMARSGFYDPDLDQSSYLRVEALVNVEPGQRPGDDVIAELKARFPNWPLKLVLVGNQYYITRPVSRGEWKGVTGGDEAVQRPDLDLAAATRGTVWSASYPEAPKFSEAPAGTVRALAQVVLHSSGFFVEPDVEEL